MSVPWSYSCEYSWKKSPLVLVWTLRPRILPLSASSVPSSLQTVMPLSLPLHSLWTRARYHDSHPQDQIILLHCLAIFTVSQLFLSPILDAPNTLYTFSYSVIVSYSTPITSVSQPSKLFEPSASWLISFVDLHMQMLVQLCSHNSYYTYSIVPLHNLLYLYRI